MGITTDPKHPDLTKGVDTEPVDQNKVYLVLSEQERAKGFVRPYRDSYVHIGKNVCGKDWEKQKDKFPEGVVKYVCGRDHGHEGDCYIGSPVYEKDLKRFESTGYLGGCGVSTKMGTALSETYARDPNFYGATYCVSCRKHLPVAEFEWDDGKIVGS